MDIVMIGCGGLASAALELLTLRGNDLFKSIDLIEPKALDYPILKHFNLKHHRVAITKKNVDKVFTPLLKGKDLVVDVSVNIDCMAIMERCKTHGVMYINTSLENWDDETELYKRTLHYRTKQAYDLFPDKDAPTFLCDHGFNPGMISSLAKLAIDNYHAYLHASGKAKTKGKRKVLETQADFSKAAKSMGLRTIHISELDTQKASIELKPDTFYNTWSAVGLVEEGRDPIQMGCGTHEKKFPFEAVKVDNMCFSEVEGLDFLMKSVAINPDLEEEAYVGYAIPHGEANSISKYLSTKDYRPSAYYVYHPSYPAIHSVNTVKTAKKEHVFSLPEIAEGFDSIGAHLFFENGDRWWTGSILTLDKVKQLGLKYSGPTEVQVAISLLSAINWMKDNRSRGLLFPEALPYRDIVNYCYPYLGLFYSDKIESIEGNSIVDFVDE